MLLFNTVTDRGGSGLIKEHDEACMVESGLRRKQKPDKTVYTAGMRRNNIHAFVRPTVHIPRRGVTLSGVSPSGWCSAGMTGMTWVSNVWVKPGVVPWWGVDCGFIMLIVFKGCFINDLLYILLFICCFHHDITALLLRGRDRDSDRWRCPLGPTCVSWVLLLPVDNDMGLDSFLIKLDSALVVVQMNEFIPKTTTCVFWEHPEVQGPGTGLLPPCRDNQEVFESGTCKLRVLFQKYVTAQVWKIQTLLCDRENTGEQWW